MQFEDIGEAIEVIAVFQENRMRPVRFRWNGRVFKIKRINGSWKSDQGAARFHHFSVMAEGPDVYEISYNPERYAWNIDRVCMEG